MAYMVNGLIAQLTKRVRATGLTFCPAFRTEAKSIFTMIGYIMKNKATAIGIEMTGASPIYIESPSR
jgi:hypothetical protein